MLTLPVDTPRAIERAADILAGLVRAGIRFTAETRGDTIVVTFD